MTKGFFIKLHHSVLQRTDISMGAKVLLALLQDYARIDDHGWAKPSIGTMAELLGVDRSVVKRTLRKLVKVKLLEIEHGTGRLSSIYWPRSGGKMPPLEGENHLVVVGLKCPLCGGKKSMLQPRRGGEMPPNQDHTTKTSDLDHLCLRCAQAPLPPFSRAQENGAEPNTGRRRPHPTQLPDQPPAPDSATSQTEGYLDLILGKPPGSETSAEGSAPARPGRTPRGAGPSAGVAPGAGPKPSDGQGSLLSDLEDLPAKRVNSRPKGQQSPRQRRKSASKGAVTTRKRKKPAKARPPDPVWDAFVAEWMPDGVPSSQRKQVGGLVRDLKDMGATVQQIRDRTKVLRADAEHKGYTLSIRTLVARWNILGVAERKAEKKRKYWAAEHAYVTRHLEAKGGGP